MNYGYVNNCLPHACHITTQIQMVMLATAGLVVVACGEKILSCSSLDSISWVYGYRFQFAKLLTCMPSCCLMNIERWICICSRGGFNSTYGKLMQSVPWLPVFNSNDVSFHIAWIRDSAAIFCEVLKLMIRGRTDNVVFFYLSVSVLVWFAHVLRDEAPKMVDKNLYHYLWPWWSPVILGIWIRSSRWDYDIDIGQQHVGSLSSQLFRSW